MASRRLISKALNNASLWSRLTEYILLPSTNQIICKRYVFSEHMRRNLAGASKHGARIGYLIQHAFFHAHNCATGYARLSDLGWLEASPYKISGSRTVPVVVRSTGVEDLLTTLATHLHEHQDSYRTNVLPVGLITRLIKQEYKRRHICGGGVWFVVDRCELGVNSKPTTIVACLWAREKWGLYVARGGLPVPVSHLIGEADAIGGNNEWLSQYKRIIHYDVPRLIAYMLIYYSELYHRTIRHIPAWIRDHISIWSRRRTWSQRQRSAPIMLRRLYDTDGNVYWSYYIVSSMLYCCVDHPLFRTCINIQGPSIARACSSIDFWRWPVDSLPRRAIAKSGLPNFRISDLQHDKDKDKYAAFTKYLAEDEKAAIDFAALTHL